METADHQALIVDQFSKQAVPFSAAKTIADGRALQLLIESAAAAADDTVLDVACGGGTWCVPSPKSCATQPAST